MKVLIEVEVRGSVVTLRDVRRVIRDGLREVTSRSLLPDEYPLEPGVAGRLRDDAGNEVGKWWVMG